MIIRVAQKKDVPDLKKIFLIARKTHFTWRDTSQFQLSDYDKATEGEDIWLAEENGRILGFIALWAPTNFIHHLFIHPHYQGKGIGKKLLEKAKEILQYPITLKVEIPNEKARLFYSKQGWSVVEENNNAEEPYYLMKLEKSEG